MTGKNLIHVKFEYPDAIQARKDMLMSEIGLLKIAQAIRKHRALRAEELDIKTKLHRRFRELKTTISKVETSLPKVKLPGRIKEQADEIKTKLDTKDTLEDNDLEKQLQDIQNQLRRLGE